MDTFFDLRQNQKFLKEQQEKKAAEEAAVANAPVVQESVPVTPEAPVEPMPIPEIGEAERLQNLLAQARKDRAMQEMSAGLGEGFKKVLAASAGGSLTQIAPDTSFEQGERKRAERGFGEKVEEYQAMGQADKKDPKSDVSKRMREFFNKTLNLPNPLPENTSAEMLENKFGALSNLAMTRGKEAAPKDDTLAFAKLKLAQDKFAFEQKKPKLKEEQVIKKENRKERQTLDKAETSLQAQIKFLEDTKDEFIEYKKKSLFGTGPIATGFGLKKYIDQPSESLESKFAKLGLDEMVKMFAGMSKAVDSDAERRAFQSTQPALKLDDKTNLALLDEKIAATKSLLDKTKRAKDTFDRTGKFLQGAEENPRYVASELSPKDKQALDWANKNPNDPRAAAIKQKLGR
jgi:hypothetical protein